MLKSASALPASKLHNSIAGEGLQILTNAWQSWPLSSEGSVACHIYSDTSLPFIISSRIRDTHTCCRAICREAVTTFFTI